MLTVHVDAGRTRIHLMHELFFAIARALPWGRLAAALSGSIVRRSCLSVAATGRNDDVAELAAAFAVAPNLLSRHLDQWLTADLWDDRRLAQDFRAAHVAALPVAAGTGRLGHRRTGDALAARREGGARALRAADISVRISRTNARAMLVSLCHFLRKAGAAGLLVVLDVRQLVAHCGRRSDAALFAGRGDGYLRGLAGDHRRCRAPARACSLRFWLTRRWPPAIRVARLVSTRRCRCASGRMCGPATGRTQWPRWCGSQRDVDARMAIEALRAGVPNRAAIRQMGTEQTDIEHAFEAALAAAWVDTRQDGAWRPTGIGMAGGFGTGKSHHARLSGRGGTAAGLCGQPCRRQQGNPAVAPGSRARRRPARRGLAGPSG